MFVTMGAFAYGQSAPSRVIAEVSASSDRVVKGAPFSADAISDSVQVLADGNRIVRNSTSKLYRNSEGRFRSEGKGGMGGVLGSHFALSPAISIIDPVVGYRYYLNPDSKTGHSVLLNTLSHAVDSNMLNVVTLRKAEKALVGAEKALVELKAAQAAGGGSNITVTSHSDEDGAERVVAVTRATAAVRATPPIPPLPPLPGNGAFGFGFSPESGNSRIEQLGVQNIEGVDAEGTRTITTIEAGKIGNERPIEIVYERWYSKELQLVVMSKRNDPRFGEQTYRLININRSEPDPSLFSLPTEYKMSTEPGGLFKMRYNKERSKKLDTVKTPTAVNVKSTKP